LTGPGIIFPVVTSNWNNEGTGNDLPEITDSNPDSIEQEQYRCSCQIREKSKIDGMVAKVSALDQP
jgi:hypothetical protein